MSTSGEPSIFTQIITRKIPATIYAETDRIIAFADISPKAPFHALVVPKTEKYQDVGSLASEDPGLLAEIVVVARQVAKQHSGDDFRLIFNTGAGAGQTVFHVHAHVLADDRGKEGSLGEF